MAKRGRVSMADLLVPENPTEVVQRPDAPYDLTDEEADEWRAIVSSMPADHFIRSSFPMLTQLCRHIVAARRISQLIEAILTPPKGRGKPAFDARAYGALLTAQSTESAAIVRLSRSMRLTQQSHYRGETTATKIKNQRPLVGLPWDKSGEEDA